MFSTIYSARDRDRDRDSDVCIFKARIYKFSRGMLWYQSIPFNLNALASNRDRELLVSFGIRY